MIIPIFAVERAQELIYYLGRLVRGGRIPGVPVYIDSPMAAEVTAIFGRFQSWFKQDAQRRMAAGEDLLNFPGLTTIRTVEESKALNYKKGPAVILATNGMCTAGRIKHHLAQYIDCRECLILFVGYQGAGTLGRQILDGCRDVRLNGRMRRVKAKVAQIEGFPATPTAPRSWPGCGTSPRRRSRSLSRTAKRMPPSPWPKRSAMSFIGTRPCPNISKSWRCRVGPLQRGAGC